MAELFSDKQKNITSRSRYLDFGMLCSFLQAILSRRVVLAAQN